VNESSTSSSDIDVGLRVSTTQELPEGIPRGSCGTVVRGAGWIQRRWRVRFDDGACVDVPEYALERRAPGRFKRPCPGA
jgi:hypothetical protein